MLKNVEKCSDQIEDIEEIWKSCQMMSNAQGEKSKGCEGCEESKR